MRPVARRVLLSLHRRIGRTAAPRRRVSARGLELTLQCDNPVTDYRWRTFESKEPETLDWIDHRVRDGDTLFDVGANIGVYTVYAALRHPACRVVAFEPEYANLHLLRDNVIENGVQDRVHVYSVALGCHCGLSQLHIQDLRPGAALHTEARGTLTETRSGKPVVWREGIWTLTLDRFCEEARLSPDCVKLDVDGTEDEILEGGTATLASPTLRSIILELPPESAGHRACEARLRAAGLEREWWDAARVSPNQVWGRP